MTEEYTSWDDWVDTHTSGACKLDGHIDCGWSKCECECHDRRIKRIGIGLSPLENRQNIFESIIERLKKLEEWKSNHCFMTQDKNSLTDRIRKLEEKELDEWKRLSFNMDKYKIIDKKAWEGIKYCVLVLSGGDDVQKVFARHDLVKAIQEIDKDWCP